MTTTIPDVGFASRTEAHQAERPQLVLKRAFDLFVTALALIVLSPVFLIVAAVLLISEGRPVFFRQRRVGRYGEPFTMWKFRTMVVDAEDRLKRLREENQRSGPLFKMSADPRVTRVGQFLRATSLDELPQLVNVLTGTMSLVGPRPALYEEREAFTADLLAREQMPPGITGLWQVEARTDGDFDRYRQLDLQYVQEWSLWLDVWLLIKTPLVLVQHALMPTIAADVQPSGPPPPDPIAVLTQKVAPKPTPAWLLDLSHPEGPSCVMIDEPVRVRVGRAVSVTT